MLARGDFKECPLIVGFNRNEGTFVVPFAFPDYIGKKDPPYIDRAMFDFVSIMGIAHRKHLEEKQPEILMHTKPTMANFHVFVA